MSVKLAPMCLQMKGQLMPNEMQHKEAGRSLRMEGVYKQMGSKAGEKSVIVNLVNSCCRPPIQGADLLRGLRSLVHQSLFSEPFSSLPRDQALDATSVLGSSP